MNTCWEKMGDIKKVGQYDKDKDNYPYLRIFTLIKTKDIKGKEVKIWTEDSTFTLNDILKEYYKIPCDRIK